MSHPKRAKKDRVKTETVQCPEASQPSPRQTAVAGDGLSLVSGMSALRALLKITTIVSQAVDAGEVLIRFLHTIVDLTNARAGAVRLYGEEGELHLVSSVGLDNDLIYRERVLPRDSCICGTVNQPGKVLFYPDLSGCMSTLGREFLQQEAPGNEGLSMIVGSIRHDGKVLGIFNLYVNSDELPTLQHHEALFSTAGEYVGFAMNKVRTGEETDQMSVAAERARMANELHDSLAQTLASIRFQVRVLDDTLHEGNEESLWESLEKIENTVDEANDELRELIAHFRAPLDEQGVLAGVTRSVERFRRYCDIPIFFQRHWPNKTLPAEYQLQIVRIVQESLANIRKHSQAKTVRILLQGNEAGDYRVLIEDDGIGFEPKPRDPGNAGEHIGLSIMKDRAKRINGKLLIESEPGEGTRVVLRFKAPTGVGEI